MTTPLHLTFHISHFTLINHLSFNRSEKRQMLIAKSMPGLRSRSHYGGVGKIDNCKLIIASGGGA